MLEKIALRMDDVGASSKRFNVYSKYPFCNILFLKYLPYLRAWGPYEELDFNQWVKIINILEKYEAKLTIGITACFVDEHSNLLPFYEKFPKQAELLLSNFKNGNIEIANHGLSHCIIGDHLPKMFKSNRSNHREFWDYLPRDWHFDHLKESQRILEDWTGMKVKTFIPPGNVYADKTIEAAEANGIEIINSSRKINNNNKKLRIIDEKNVFAFHDRELVLYGTKWLEKEIIRLKDKNKFVLIRDL